MLSITQQKMYYLIYMYMYRRLLATISPLGFYVLVHFDSQYFYDLKETENVPNQSGVRLNFVVVL